jgi:RimJ/RimL family protein N-acetyltransferase
MRYDLSYSGTMKLDDGAVVRLRPIRPDDKPALVAAFEKLSAASRRSRFLSAKKGLSEADLSFYTEVDGLWHYAIVALADGPGGTVEGVGVARFVRSPDEPEIAEIAIVVADAWQQRGVGGRLMRIIVAAAGERNVRKIRAISDAGNVRLRKLLEPYGSEVRLLPSSGGAVEILIDVPSDTTGDAFDTLTSLLRLAALGSLIVPIRIGRASLELLAQMMEERKQRDRD